MNRSWIIIGAVIVIVIFIGGFLSESKTKSASQKAANGIFTVGGVIALVIGFLIAAWVLSLFATGPEDLPSPTDYGG